MSELVVRDLCNIIKSALWQKPMPEVEMSEELIRLIMRQGLGPLVFPRMLDKGVRGLEDERIKGMKSVCIQNMQMQAKMQMVMERAWNALEKAGIKAVLMKGAGLAALYPDPSMRQWCDIDLYVGPEQYHPACAVMRETFPKALKFDEELDHYKHYNLIADGVSIEIHRVTVGLMHPKDVRRYAKMERFGMAHTSELVIGNCKLKIFEPTFNVLMVFMHAWEHMITSGANVRQLCDLALLLHHQRDQIDWKRLERWLKDLNVWDVWKVYLFVLMHELGVSELVFSELGNEGVRGLEVRGERLLSAMLGERVRGLEEGSATGKAKHYSNRFVRKWHTMQVRRANAEWVAQFSLAYARHMKAAIWLSGLARLFAKDRHWE